MNDKEKQIQKAIDGEGTFADAIAGMKLTPELISKIQEYYKLANKDRSIVSSIDDEEMMKVFRNSINNRYETLKEINDAIELDIEKKETSESIKNMKKDMDEMVASNEETRRDIMENRLINKANELKDEKEKEKLLAMSKAYTDSYTLEPLMKFIEEEDFKKKYDRAVKRYNRYFMDFDYVLEKTSNASISNLSKVYQLMKKTKSSKDTKVTFEDDEPMLFCLTLALYCKNTSLIDKPKIWYMYSSMISILHLLSSATLTPFIKEKVEYLNKFFDKIKKVVKV